MIYSECACVKYSLETAICFLRSLSKAWSFRDLVRRLLRYPWYLNDITYPEAPKVSTYDGSKFLCKEFGHDFVQAMGLRVCSGLGA